MKKYRSHLRRNKTENATQLLVVLLPYWKNPRFKNNLQRILLSLLKNRSDSFKNDPYTNSGIDIKSKGHSQLYN